VTASKTLQSYPFMADCSRRADQVSLRVTGRLVSARRPSVDWLDCIDRMGGSEVRIDLDSVTEIDARGLGMLAELARHLRARDRRVVVVRASPRVRRLLTLTHLDALLAEPVGPRAAA
jgi:anti-anti-sigma factor